MADRYTYIPLIGIFIILAFGAADLAAGIKRRQVALTALFGLALVACLFLTWRQVGYWRDSATIYSHALEVTENNYIAYNNLGMTYYEAGRHDEAMAMFYQAIRSNPKFAEAYNNIGLELAGRGDFSAAISRFQQALRLQPNIKKAHSNLGMAYLKQGRVEEAWEMFRTALKNDPANADPNNLASACNILAIYLADQGESAFAIRFFQEAIRLQPNYDRAYYNLGLAYLKQDLIIEAREMFEMALKKNPNNAGAREMLDSIRNR
jgi:tetratricopeptide (TPR) repeat protein